MWLAVSVQTWTATVHCRQLGQSQYSCQVHSCLVQTLSHRGHKGCASSTVMPRSRGSNAGQQCRVYERQLGGCLKLRAAASVLAAGAQHAPSSCCSAAQPT